MELHFSLFYPYLLAFGVALAPVPLFILWAYWRQCVRRARPRPDKLLSGPGDSQREKIAQLNEKIAGAVIWWVAIPVAATGAIMAPRLTGVEPLTGPDLFALPGLALALLLFPTIAMVRYCRERQAHQHKLDAELTVGREINLLLREGFYIFHDVPEDSGNVNHVVVGLSGIFAVETVGRPVPDLGRGIVDAKVIYDGENLFFPPKNLRESEAVKQSRRQAIAMERWLGDALGWSVQVRSALALPGWFVERKRP
ncbi:MAG TPA: nuclease-related domain-containing protein, partial [Desulfurivibrionaceae bacterium]|nr:nuclease-related domain-containing protein [Desulfurivibrionaceae bacterium]